MIQLQFLNYILSTGDISLIVHNNLTKDFFRNYVEEFEFIKNHCDEYNCVPDMETFINKFPDFEIIKVNEKREFLISELFKCKKRGDMVITIKNAADAINNDDLDTAEAIYKNGYEQLVSNEHVDCVDIFKDTSRFNSFMEKNRAFEKFYISTGFKHLDALIGGWDRKEELATIVARPGVGKSWVLLKTAVAAVGQGLRVGLYSGEMSVDMVGFRADTLISEISNYGITRATDDVIVEYQKYIESLPSMFDKGCLKVLTPNMIDGPAGVTALRAFIEKEHLDMLCIDQHSLLEDDRKGRTPVEKASNISKDLKNLQVLTGIPIIAVSQQNRSSTETSGVSTEHVAQSDRISQDSTVILFIEQDKEHSQMTITLVKSRNSVSGAKLLYGVDLNRGKFVPIGDTENPPSEEESERLRKQYETDKSSGEGSPF